MDDVKSTRGPRPHTAPDIHRRPHFKQGWITGLKFTTLNRHVYRLKSSLISSHRGCATKAFPLSILLNRSATQIPVNQTLIVSLVG